MQEIREETIQCISETLPSHHHIEDAHPGWSCESNIFWNHDYFKKLEHGHENLNMPEVHRGLFWVRLKLKGSTKTLLIATAQPGKAIRMRWIRDSPKETNKRVKQLNTLKKLRKKNELVFFMGDLNDPVLHMILFPEAGYQSCFKELNLLCPPTFPALPTTDDIGENQVIDWIFSNGKATAISASVPQLYYEHMSPSDHWPVQAFYRLD